MQIDKDFLEALMVGMLFANQTTIREVILFPHLRNKQHDD
jgi:lysyl-tRNA synthetase class II